MCIELRSLTFLSIFQHEKNKCNMGLLVSILIGAVAGWLAGIIMKSKAGGVLLNILLGIAGGFVGNWLFEFFGISAGSGWLGAIVSATAGAVVLILVVRIFFRGK
jgi:uncharacterized membrane protein YeaQ/YmgE (transglycosylase-associated protein family)